MRMGLFGSSDNLALQITQRGKKRDGAVADIIMCLGASVALFQRKGALGALQSLALTFLVAAEHQSPLGRIQIEPDDVPEFLLKVRIIGDLKSLQPMWLYFVMAPNALLCSCSPWLRAPSSARSIGLDLAPVESLFQRSRRLYPPEVALYGLCQPHP